MIQLLIVILFYSIILKADSSCSDWFNSLAVSQKPDCVSLCNVAKVDMSTFLCHQKCESLCKKADSENYFGLTESEIAFCKDNKINCLKAYKLSWDSEKICLSIYTFSDMNDESDACRHYVWAILMSREIGIKDAETVLNAHEENSKEPKNQQAMDLANNRLGLLNYQKDSNYFKTDLNIKNSFIDQIKKNKFIIIKPNYSNKGGIP